MVEYTGLGKNSKKILINPLGVHRNMRGCILEISCEGLGW